MKDLMHLYTLTQQELSEHIYTLLDKSKYYETPLSTPYGIIAIPKKEYATPTVLVAHLDTINTHYGIEPQIKDMYVDDNIIGLLLSASPMVACLGADDRNGVYVALTMAGIYDMNSEPQHVPTLIFPFDEEIGCVGSSGMVSQYMKGNNPTFDKAINHITENNHCMIQIDRGVHGVTNTDWGGEVVYYEEENEDFIVLMNTFYQEEIGSFTDICQLVGIISLACCNVSAGYRMEHTREEETNLLLLQRTIRTIEEVMCYVHDKSPYRHVEASPLNYYPNFFDFSDDSMDDYCDSDDAYDSYPDR